MKRMYRQPWHLCRPYVYVLFLIVTVLIISETWKIEVGRPPIEVFHVTPTVTCMPSDAAYQAFWWSSVRSCVCRLSTTMCCLYIRLINLLVAWRVCGCREKAYIYI